MTKKESAPQILVREKKFKRGYFLGLAAMGLWMLVAPALDHFYNLNQSKILLQTWAVGGFILGVLFFVVFLVFSSQRGVPCRHCGKRLFGIPGQIAVATGNCGYCGEKAFD